jgi:hypothetical protein
LFSFTEILHLGVFLSLFSFSFIIFPSSIFFHYFLLCFSFPYS